MNDGENPWVKERENPQFMLSPDDLEVHLRTIIKVARGILDAVSAAK